MFPAVNAEVVKSSGQPRTGTQEEARSDYEAIEGVHGKFVTVDAGNARLRHREAGGD
jgi:hypothetical protein